MYQLSEGSLQLALELQRPRALKCGTFGASEARQLVTGDFEGQLACVDLNTQTQVARGAGDGMSLRGS